MPRSSSSRSGSPAGVRALVSHAYPAYIHHSTPKMSSTRSAPAGVRSRDNIAGQLGDGEDEDQVEEELQGADPQRLAVVRTQVRVGHRRAAMSRRYQPPRSSIVAASA